jgi:general stress protein 26
MGEMSIQDIAEQMRNIDFTMLTTRTKDGALASRPMSNNGEVEFDGDCWFFAYDSSRAVSDISADPAVMMTLQGRAGLLGAPPLFISIAGKAEIVRDKAIFERHWMEELQRWFADRTDTPGMVMIKVRAERVHYWNGEEEGDVTV